ncbi:MAG: 2-dehydropantoate 2-reductase N-terminal domain-containing protein [Dehalococcoidia bacterium]
MRPSAVSPIVGPNTALLCIQNGIDNEDALVAAFGVGRVLGGATRIEGATLPEPECVAHLSPFAGAGVRAPRVAPPGRGNAPSKPPCAPPASA